MFNTKGPESDHTSISFRLKDVGMVDRKKAVVQITLEHLFDLTVCEFLMQLGHNQNLRFWT